MGPYIFITNRSWQFSEGYKYYSLLANKLIFSVPQLFPTSPTQNRVECSV